MDERIFCSNEIRKNKHINRTVTRSPSHLRGPENDKKFGLQTIVDFEIIEIQHHRGSFEE